MLANGFRDFQKDDWYVYGGAQRFNDDSEPVIADIVTDACDISVIADNEAVLVDIFSDGHSTTYLQPVEFANGDLRKVATISFAEILYDQLKAKAKVGYDHVIDFMDSTGFDKEVA